MDETKAMMMDNHKDARVVEWTHGKVPADLLCYLGSRLVSLKRLQYELYHTNSGPIGSVISIPCLSGRHISLRPIEDPGVELQHRVIDT